MLDVTSVIAGVLVVAGYGGLAVGSLSIGQFIVTEPMCLMYVGLGISLFCLGICVLVALVGRSWSRANEEEGKAT